MTHTDELFEPHEDELRDLLERTMSDTAAPLEIGPHALREGRRLRTRRRVGIAAAAVAASVAGALILPVALGGGSTEAVDPAGRPASSASEPATDPLVREQPDGWWSMPTVDMISAVEAILPDGITVTDPGPLMADTEEGGPGVGFINAFVSGPAGPGRLNVMLYPEPPEAVTLTPSPGTDEGGNTAIAPSGDDQLQVTQDDATSDISCAAELAGRTQCTQLFNGQGAIIGRSLVTHWGETITNEVVLRRDGGTVYAASVNTLDDKWGRTSPASAELPPLTLDQLEALVRNDTWVRPAT